MESNINNLVNGQNFIQNNREEWDTFNEICKQEIGNEYYEIVEEIKEEENKPPIINLQTNCDVDLNSVRSERGRESPEILFKNDRRGSTQKKETVANSIEQMQSTGSQEKLYQKLGTCNKLFVYLQRDNLQQLQKREHYKHNESESSSFKTKWEKLLERCSDKYSGKILKCFYCEFQSIYLENMVWHMNSTHKTEFEMVPFYKRSYREMVTQERICGLCFKVCDNFRAIEGNMKDVVDVVLPKIASATLQELLVCKHCMEMLIKCFDFKTACLNTYKYTAPVVNNNDNVTLNLKNIYQGKNENGTGVMEDRVICGFCMDPIKNNSAISLDVGERDFVLKKMIQQCLPELDLSLIEKPVICTPCHLSLVDYFHFITNCLLVEENIKKHCETLDIDSSSQIELSSLLQFTIKNVATTEVKDNLVDIIKEEKQFCDERTNTEERNIDNGGDLFKLEQMSCADSQNATKEEGNKFSGIKVQEKSFGENETCLKEENLLEMVDPKFLVKEEIEIKTDEPDFVRFEDGVALLQPEVTTITQGNVTEITTYTCDYQARRKDYRKAQMLIHKSPEVTLYECDSCSFQTKYKSSLIIHLLPRKNSSTKVVVYKCDICSFQTRQKRCVTKHLLEHKNSEVAMYKCNSCSYKTKIKRNLERHLLLHKSPSELTMHKCDSCSYQTMYYDYLKKHLPIHKSPTDITMYKCNSCTYQTRQKSNLKRHVLVHRVF